MALFSVKNYVNSFICAVNKLCKIRLMEAFAEAEIFVSPELLKEYRDVPLLLEAESKIDHNQISQTVFALTLYLLYLDSAIGSKAHIYFFSHCAASFAQYVRIMSAPARLMPVKISSATRFSSIHPFSAAAFTTENSPLTL